MPASDPSPATDPTSRRQARPWELAALAGLVLAVVVVLALTGFSRTERGADGAVGTAQSDTEARAAAVQTLLDTWASAVRTNDAARLSGLMDQAAAPGFLAAETRRAGNVAGVEFSDWGYEIAEGAETAVPSSLVDALGADEVWAPAVQLRYAIADESPTRKPVALVVARRGDRWALVSDSATVDGERRTWRGPWDFGPVVSRRVDTGDGRTSVVLGHPENAAMVDRLADELPAAVVNATQLWGSNWAGRALVWVAGSQDEFTALVGPNHDGRDIAAVAISDAVDPDAATVTGQRIVFSPASADRLTEVTRRAILRHELIHVAARAETVDRSPMWVLEGYAEYAAYRGTGEAERQIAPALTAQVGAEGPPTEFPEDTDFSGYGERGSVAYETAWSINAFVAEQYGESRLTALYRTLAVGEADPETVDGRLSDVLGVDADQFRDRWTDWVGAHLG
ncbi:peptidase MA family metallohydrolase [Rhodococcus wratislaviensis]|uniref:peptidase MA family metallohydrolase n=1 Tax=Rhodococcus wratislaviensis TaxID=44752 RepID=UPI00365217E2